MRSQDSGGGADSTALLAYRAASAPLNTCPPPKPAAEHDTSPVPQQELWGEREGGSLESQSSYSLFNP